MSEGNASCGGQFLIASPYLTDGFFFRSVVLVVRHETQGALGVVINRPGTDRWREVLTTSSATKPTSPVAEEASENEADSAERIFVGGPVEGPLLALHDIAGIGDPCQRNDSAEGSSSAADSSGISATVHDNPAEAFGSLSIHWADAVAWLTADEDHLRLLANRADARVKFVINYSGWGPGQLDRELNDGGWLVTPADTESIFDAGDDIWERLVKKCGHRIMSDLTGDQAVRDVDGSFDSGLN
ncbi:MAG: YqgE/AlgH family protein [Planctomycetota bacterium]